MKVRTMAVAALACGGLLLAGCAGTSVDGPEESAGELVAVPGFDPEAGTIKVGVINPLSGPLATAGQGILLGTQMYIDRINDEGGIAGKYQVEIVTGDSEYDPQTAISVYNGMVDDVVMVGTSFGTAVTKALLPQAEVDSMLIIPSSDSSEWLHEPNLLSPRPTNEVQIINGLAYAAEQGGDDQTLCAFLQDDPLGEAIKVGTDYAAEELGLDVAAEVRFPVTTTDFTPQISELKSAGCDLVSFGSTSTAAISAMASAVQLNFNPMWVAVAPGVGANLLGTPVLDYIQDHWIVSAVGAEWGDDSVEGMAQLEADFEKYAPADTALAPGQFVPGYTYGIAIAQILEEAVAAGDLSHESVLAASHSGLELNFLDLSPNFRAVAPADRQAPTQTTIYQVDAEIPGLLKTVERNYESDAARDFSAS